MSKHTRSGLAAALGEQGRRRGAAGGAAEHRQRGVVGRDVEPRQAAARLHDRRGGQARFARRVQQAAQVARQQGGEGGVDLGRRGALELAEGADDLVRERHVDAEALAQRVADRALVVGVAVAVQQADRDRLGLGCRHGLDEILEAAQRLEHAGGPGALVRGEAPLGWGQRRRVRGAQPVELAPGLSAEGDDVGEAARGDEGRARDGALEQRVGRDRHAVGEALDVARPRAGVLERALDGGHDPARLVVGRRRRLGRVHDAVGDQDGVREGAAHVDAQEHPRTLDDARHGSDYGWGAGLRRERLGHWPTDQLDLLGLGQVLMRRAVAVVVQRHPLAGSAATGRGAALQWLAVNVESVLGHAIQDVERALHVSLHDAPHPWLGVHGEVGLDLLEQIARWAREVVAIADEALDGGLA